MPQNPSHHYELSELIDYVRKTGSQEKLQAIDAHLKNEGCELCGRNAEMLAEAYGAARVLARVEVPAAVVQRSNEIFRRPAAAPVPDNWWNTLPALTAQLVFGEALEPLPAGLRSSASAARQVSYTSSFGRVRYVLDVDSRGTRTIVGVLTDFDDGPQAAIPVLLLAKEKVLDGKQTSEFGEFQFELPDQRNLRLLFLVDKHAHSLEVHIPA